MGGRGASSGVTQSNSIVPQGFNKSSFTQAITDFRTQYANADIEYGASINDRGKISKAVKGNKNTVETPRKNGEVSIHNHPSGGVFSQQDIQGVTLNSTKGTVVVTNKGTYYFIKTKDFDGVALESRLRKGAWFGADNKYREDWLKDNQKKYGYFYKFEGVKK